MVSRLSSVFMAEVHSTLRLGAQGPRELTRRTQTWDRGSPSGHRDGWGVWLIVRGFHFPAELQALRGPQLVLAFIHCRYGQRALPSPFRKKVARTQNCLIEANSPLCPLRMPKFKAASVEKPSGRATLQWPPRGLPSQVPTVVCGAPAFRRLPQARAPSGRGQRGACLLC